MFALSIDDYLHNEGVNDVVTLDHVENTCDLPTSPEYEIEAFVNMSTCDFKWTGKKRQPMITLFAVMTKERRRMQYFAAAWDVGMNEARELALVHERPPVPYPTLNYESYPMTYASAPASISAKFLSSRQYRYSKIESGCSCYCTETIQYGTLHNIVGITEDDELVVRQTWDYEGETDEDSSNEDSSNEDSSDEDNGGCDRSSEAILSGDEGYDSDHEFAIPDHNIFVGSISDDYIRIKFPVIEKSHKIT